MSATAATSLLRLLHHKHVTRTTKRMYDPLFLFLSDNLGTSCEKGGLLFLRGGAEVEGSIDRGEGGLEGDNLMMMRKNEKRRSGWRRREKEERRGSDGNSTSALGRPLPFPREPARKALKEELRSRTRALRASLNSSEERRRPLSLREVIFDRNSCWMAWMDGNSSTDTAASA